MNFFERCTEVNSFALQTNIYCNDASACNHNPRLHLGKVLPSSVQLDRSRKNECSFFSLLM